MGCFWRPYLKYYVVFSIIHITLNSETDMAPSTVEKEMWTHIAEEHQKVNGIKTDGDLIFFSHTKLQVNHCQNS